MSVVIKLVLGGGSPFFKYLVMHITLVILSRLSQEGNGKPLPKMPGIRAWI